MESLIPKNEDDGAPDYPRRRKRIWSNTSKVPLQKADGEVFGILGIYDDITERLQAEAALSQSLAEKTALLKEVHHRQKQPPDRHQSLEPSSKSLSRTEKLLRFLEETASRVHSMALLHEALYRSDNLTTNFASYVTELCQYLRRSYGLAAARVSLDNWVAPVGLPLEMSLPCGLIITELVSNALKHAFLDERRGQITVELSPVPPASLPPSASVMTASGRPPAWTWSRPRLRALRLVARLVTQLHGQLTVTRPEASGLTFTLDFPAPPETLAED